MSVFDWVVGVVAASLYTYWWTSMVADGLRRLRSVLRRMSPPPAASESELRYLRDLLKRPGAVEALLGAHVLVPDVARAIDALRDLPEESAIEMAMDRLRRLDGQMASKAIDALRVLPRR